MVMFVPTRRDILVGLAGGLVGGLAGPGVASTPGERPPLRAMAASHGILYGCCIAADQVRAGGDFTALVRRECAALVPENELKWSNICAAPEQYDFAPADAIVD